MLTGVDGATCSAVVLELVLAVSPSRLDCEVVRSFLSFSSKQGSRLVGSVPTGRLLLLISKFPPCFGFEPAAFNRFVSVMTIGQIRGSKNDSENFVKLNEESLVVTTQVYM